MDRSKGKVILLNRVLLPSLAVAIFALLGVSSSFSQNQSQDKSKNQPVVSTGIYYGFVEEIDAKKRAIFVRPAQRGFSRKLFYYDADTNVFLGERLSKVTKIEPSHKVAVKYFASDAIAIADEIFVVFGEFNPRLYKKKRKLPEK